jgi:hypothetical protein
MNWHTFEPGKRALSLLSAFAILSNATSATGGSVSDSVSAELRSFVHNDSTGRCGVLFGKLEGISCEPQIWTAGAINQSSDLRLGCPTAKPLLAYLTLKVGIPLDVSIDRWFPEREGFLGSHLVTVQNLLSNMSGIRDYVPLVPMNPDSAISPQNSVDRAFRNQTLLFKPGDGFEYSNTNFNMIGLILESTTGKPVIRLFQQYFCRYAPSLRIDDGKGDYPRGYARPWPYHWSAPGYAGGFIGTAADAMRVFYFVSERPEFKVMTTWLAPKGSDQAQATDNLVGLGIFGRRNYAGRGEAIVYEGNMGPCQMILAKLGDTVFYIATAHSVPPADLSILFQKLITFSQ